MYSWISKLVLLASVYPISASCAALESHNPSTRHVRRQNDQKYIEQTLYLIERWWEGGSLYTNFSLGTPPQNVIVGLDTTYGSTFVQSSNFTECTGSQCSDGTFNANASSSVVTDAVSSWSWSWAAGNFITDVVELGSVSVDGIQMGLAYTGEANTNPEGLLGVGYSVNSIYSSDLGGDALDTPDRGFLGQLAEAGAINSRLVSISVGARDGTGSLIFGGVDMSKYIGDFATLDVVASPWTLSDNQTVYGAFANTLGVTDIHVVSDGTQEYQITWDTSSTGESDGGLPSTFDTEDAWWEVTQYAYDVITTFIPNFDADSGFIPCDYSALEFIITFGGAINITVPISDLTIPVYDLTTGLQNTTSAGLPLCQLALRVYNGDISDPFYMGFSVLRSMYVVLDLDNGQISIGQSNLNSSVKSDIYAVPAGNDGLSKVFAEAGKTIISPTTSIPIFSAVVSPTVSPASGFSVGSVSPAVGEVTGSLAIPTAGVVHPAVTSTSKTSSSSSFTATSTTSTSSATSTTSTGAASTTTTKSGTGFRSGGIDSLTSTMFQVLVGMMVCITALL